MNFEQNKCALSWMSSDWRAIKTRAGRAGFTLLEILVALAILSMIMLMMSAVFTQANMAWRTGIRKARINMQGRAAIDFMAQELANAVADPVILDYNFPNGGSRIEFYAFAGHQDTPTNNRVVSKIVYEKIGKQVKRTVTLLDVSGYAVAGASDSSVLVKNVAELKFTVPPGAPAGSLPKWVTIRLEIEQNDKVVYAGAASQGPPGGDPIRSWE